jgi:hypothetical protein
VIFGLKGKKCSSNCTCRDMYIFLVGKWRQRYPFCVVAYPRKRQDKAWFSSLCELYGRVYGKH